MIICSCRTLCTKKIKDCLESQSNPTIQSVLKELDWKPDCKTCVQNIVKEITIQLERKRVHG